MLERPERLSSQILAAVAALERAVVDVDGGRLKLEWHVLESGEGVEPLLWREGDRVVGFAGLYAFGGPAIEVAGMVAPDRRRRGIGRALLDAALHRCAERGQERPLLVVPRSSAGGRHLALSHGGTLDHSEHAMVLRGRPRLGPGVPGVALRRATPADAPAVSGLLEAAFGYPVPGMGEQLATDDHPVLLVELAGAPVGTVSIQRRGDTATVYGLAVDPAHQGRGIGREVLGRVCEQLQAGGTGGTGGAGGAGGAGGVGRVGLDVAVDNDRALGLYTSVGFEPVTTEDYYALPVGLP